MLGCLILNLIVEKWVNREEDILTMLKTKQQEVKVILKIYLKRKRLKFLMEINKLISNHPVLYKKYKAQIIKMIIMT